MTPLKQWLAVKPDQRIAGGYLWVPNGSELAECRVGQVVAAGHGVELKNGMSRPLDVCRGDRIIYSSRVDTYQVGDDKVDMIEEASVIGIMNGLR